MTKPTNVYSAPRIPPGSLARRKLEFLLSGVQGGIVWLYAPAGTGKTIAVARWLQLYRSRIAWLSLSPEDNQMGRFSNQFMQAIAAACPQKRRFSAAARNILSALDPMEHLLSALALLKGDDKQYRIIVDDAHFITQEHLQQYIFRIVGKLPDNWTTVFISRKRPWPAMDRALRQYRGLLLDSAYLRFDSKEVADLYSLAGEKLTEYAARRIARETEGLAIAVAARLLTDAGTAVKSGSTLTWEDYLEKYIWSRWSKDRQETLIIFSVVDTLSLDLCYALTGLRNTGQLLRELTNERAFVTPLQGGAYCLHHLFRAYLQKKFSLLPGDFRRDIHRRAGDWHLSQKDAASAISHFAKAGCKAGIEAAVAQFLNRETALCVQEREEFIRLRIINQVPLPIVSQSPALLSQCAAVCFFDGNVAGYGYYIDLLQPYLSVIAVQNTDLLRTSLLIVAIDCRRSMRECVAQILKFINPDWTADTPHTGSKTINLPWMHRSMRDYTEYANAAPEDLLALRQAIGPLLGADFDALYQSLVTGLLWEQGKLSEALEQLHSIRIKAEEQGGCETVFSITMLESAILENAGDLVGCKMAVQAAERLARQKALFLLPNLRAWKYSIRLRHGQREMGAVWLQKYAVGKNAPLLLIGLFQHFTTMQAYLAGGAYSDASVFGNRLTALVQEHRRPLDTIEASCLLAIAYWKQNMRCDALREIKESLKLSQGHKFVRIYMEYGIDILPILYAARKKYRSSRIESKVDISFLHMVIKRTSDYIYDCKYPGLCPPDNSVPKLTKQQMKVLEILCAQGGPVPYDLIAGRLGVARSTAKSHVLELYRRLGVSDARAAIKKASILVVT